MKKPLYPDTNNVPEYSEVNLDHVNKGGEDYDVFTTLFTLFNFFELY